MRWVKHMTATAQDEKIARLIAKYGHAGYGLWWLVVEAVAARLEGDGQPSVTYPVTKWSHLLSLRGSHVRQSLSKLEVTHLVTVEWIGSEIRVTIPNLLKYRDEYTRKSGHAHDDVRSKKQIQNTDTEAELETEKLLAPVGALAVVRAPKGKRSTDEIRKALGSRLTWWEEFWSVYPCHEGMNPAMDSFERTVKTQEMFLAVMDGARRYAAKARADPTLRLKYGQGWINDQRWTDEISIHQPRPTQLGFEQQVNQRIEEALARGENPW